MNNFAHIVDAASDKKRSFDSSIESVKDMLDKSVRGFHDVPSNIGKMDFSDNGLRTGWLRGSLSYPWVIVCFIIPAVLDTLV